MLRAGVRDDLVPNGTWAFDESVADRFDDMLERSIPHFEAMRAAVTTLAAAHLRSGGVVVDLGCSLGGGIVELQRAVSADVSFVGVDASLAMVDRARVRFDGDVRVSIRCLDLAVDYPSAPATVTMAVLTLQFMPLVVRRRVLARAAASTPQGGVLIVVEKVAGASQGTQRLLRQAYHDHKRSMGYTDEQIAAKERSLEGVLVPLPATENEDLIRSAGWRDVECFWRWMNFAGWIAVR